MLCAEAAVRILSGDLILDAGKPVQTFSWSCYDVHINV